MFFTMILSVSAISAKDNEIDNVNDSSSTLNYIGFNSTGIEVEITNPETGESKIYVVENVPTESKIKLLSGNDQTEVCVNIQFDEEWNPIIMPMVAQEAVKHDGITMTAGMEYSVTGTYPNQKVSMKRVYGTYQNKGYYYHEAPSDVWYANSMGYYADHKRPTGHSFNYTVNNTYVDYMSSPFNPYVESETKVKVSGMGGSRTISVRFAL